MAWGDFDGDGKDELAVGVSAISIDGGNNVPLVGPR